MIAFAGRKKAAPSERPEVLGGNALGEGCRIATPSRPGTVDLGTGRVLQSAYRRSGVIESLHDGSFFGGEAGRLGLFLPAGIVLFVMWVTGIWMFTAPLLAKRRRRRQRRPEALRRAA